MVADLDVIAMASLSNKEGIATKMGEYHRIEEV